MRCDKHITVCWFLIILRFVQSVIYVRCISITYLYIWYYILNALVVKFLPNVKATKTGFFNYKTLFWPELSVFIEVKVKLYLQIQVLESFRGHSFPVSSVLIKNTKVVVSSDICTQYMLFTSWGKNGKVGMLRGEQLFYQSYQTTIMSSLLMHLHSWYYLPWFYNRNYQSSYF